MFNTVLYDFRSLRNVGSIARSHLAFGGNNLIIVGNFWDVQFKRGSEAFAKKMEAEKRLLRFENWHSYLSCFSKNNVAVEIDKNGTALKSWSEKYEVNLVFGNERTGLPINVISDCDEIVSIPLTGEVASLNVAATAAICFYKYTEHVMGNVQIQSAKFIV